MSNSVQRTVLILVCIVALIIGLVFGRAFREPHYSPEQLAQMGAVVRDQPKILAPFQLMDHNAEVFNNERLAGKWSLLFFGFTNCPDICPTAMSLLAQLRGKLADTELKDQTQVILVSVDPARDLPENLKKYVTHFNKSFIGVTGEVDALHQFALDTNSLFAKVPLSEDDPMDYTMDHSAHIVLINPQGQYHGFFRAPHVLTNLERTYKAIAGS